MVSRLFAAPLYKASHPEWDNRSMTNIRIPKLYEQRKVEKLLIKLANIEPVSATPAPVLNTKIDLRTA